MPFLDRDMLDVTMLLDPEFKLRKALLPRTRTLTRTLTRTRNPNPDPNPNPNPNPNPSPNPNSSPNPNQGGGEDAVYREVAAAYATQGSTPRLAAEPQTHATQGSNLELADRVPGRSCSATHTLEPRLEQARPSTRPTSPTCRPTCCGGRRSSSPTVWLTLSLTLTLSLSLAHPQP